MPAKATSLMTARTLVGSAEPGRASVRLLRWPDQDLVDVDALGLRKRVDHGPRDVRVVKRVVGPGGILEERRVDHPRLDQGHPDALVVVHLAELLTKRLADPGDGPLGR